MIYPNTPNKFNADLSADLRWFYENNFLLQRWGVLYTSWDIFYSIPNTVFTIYEWLHYVFFGIFNGNIVYTFKAYTALELFAAGTSMFFISYKLTNRKVASLLGAVFYVLTPYFLGELVSHVYLLWSYALLPIAYYFTYRALVAKSWKLALLSGLTISLVTTFDQLQAIYTVGICLAFFAILISLLYSDTTNKRAFSKSIALRIGILAIIIVTIFLLSVYLVIPYFYANPSVSSTNAFYIGTQLNSYSLSTTQSLMLYYYNQPNLIAAFILVAFSSCSLLFAKRKLHFALFITAIAALFLAMGSTTPVFPAIAKFVPGMDATRVSGRFLVTACFAFSFIGALGVESILRKFSRLYSVKKLPHYRIRKPLFSILIILILLLPVLFVCSSYNWANSSDGPLSVSADGPNIQQLYDGVRQFLDKSDPQHAYRVIDLVSDNGKIYSFDHKALPGYLTTIDLFLSYYKSPSFAKILSMYGVKYIIAPAYGVEWFGFEDTGVHFYDINYALSHSPDFKIAFQILNLVVYENKLTMPWMFLAGGALTLGGPQTMSLFYVATAQNVNSSAPGTMNQNSLYAAIGNQSEVLMNVQQVECNFSSQSFSSYNSMIFHDSDIVDLAMLQRGDLAQPWKEVNINNARNWVVSRMEDYPYDHAFFNLQDSKFGQFAFADFLTATYDITDITVPFSVSKVGNYSIWLRALLQWSLGNLTLRVDNNPLENMTFDDTFGFNWIKTNVYQLEAGNHEITIWNNKPTALYLDVVTPVIQSELDSEVNELSSLLEQSNLKTMYLLEFANAFSGIHTYQSTKESNFASNVRSGYMWMLPKGVVSRNMTFASDDIYTFGIRMLVPSGAIKLKVDDQTIYSTSVQNSNSSYWIMVTANPTFISKGNHNISVENSFNDTMLDFMYIASLGYQNSQKSLSSAADGIGFNQKGPTSWQVSANLNQSTFLVFLDSYYGSQWSLTSEDKNDVYSIPTLYILNAFHLTPQTMSYVLSYSEPQIFLISSGVSITTFVVIVAVISYSFLRKHWKGNLSYENPDNRAR